MNYLTLPVLCCSKAFPFLSFHFLKLRERYKLVMFKTFRKLSVPIYVFPPFLVRSWKYLPYQNFSLSLEHAAYSPPPISWQHNCSTMNLNQGLLVFSNCPVEITALSFALRYSLLDSPKFETDCTIYLNIFYQWTNILRTRLVSKVLFSVAKLSCPISHKHGETINIQSLDCWYIDELFHSIFQL